MHARTDGSIFPQYSGMSSHSKGACIPAIFLFVSGSRQNVTCDVEGINKAPIIIRHLSIGITTVTVIKLFITNILNSVHTKNSVNPIHTKYVV
jgi:hypothetical protein